LTKGTLGLPQGKGIAHVTLQVHSCISCNAVRATFELDAFFDFPGNNNLNNVPSNQQRYFCQQLTDWLYRTEWHFTTLLAVCIDSVKELPDDIDNFINYLLLSYPEKPSHSQLSDYINSSILVKSWFQSNSVKPSVRSLNLDILDSGPDASCKLPQFDSLPDLAYWLGLSTNQLTWLADLMRIDRDAPEKYKHYHYSFVQKRRGGTRLIESPKSLLKRVQRQINSRLLSKVDVHSAAHGFRQHRNCLTHAENHTNQSYLFSFDLAHYFHSIDWYCVYKIYRSLGYAHEISQYLSGLCTHRLNAPQSMLNGLDDEQLRRINKRHLPQGAPTSPALSNLVMRNLDKRLAGLANSLDLNYSRYADDLAFSGNKHRDWRFLEPLIGSICLEEGFELNYRKSRIARSHQRQKLTGVIVNKHTNIDRRYYDRVKAILTNCLRHGIEDQNIERHDNFQAHLLGCIMFINSLNKRRGEKLLGLYRQINFTSSIS